MRVVVDGESSSSLRNSASAASSQRRMRKYAIPSASRIDALSGSRRFAFSSGTVACAACPSADAARPCWKSLYARSSPQVGKFSSTKSSGSVKSRVGPISTPAIVSPGRSRCWNASASSYGGPARPLSERSKSSPSAQSGAAGERVRRRRRRAPARRGRPDPDRANRCGGCGRGRAGARSRRPRRAAKRATSPGVNTVSAPMTRRRLAPADARRTASAEPTGSGWRTKRTSPERPSQRALDLLRQVAGDDGDRSIPAAAARAAASR